jgi:hypothetical protein
VIGRCVVDRRVRGWCRRGILGDKLTRRIDEDSRVAANDLLDALSFAVVVVTTDRRAVSLYFSLFVVTVEDEISDMRGSRIEILDDVSVLIKAEL